MHYSDWTLAWQDWLFELPWWAAMLALVGITPVAIWLIRGAIQGLWVNPFTHDWAAANFDIVLGFAAGAAFLAIHSLPAEAGFVQGPTYVVLNYGGIAAGLGFAMYKWWDERKYVSGWRSRLGATSLYHVLVLTFMTPLLAVLIVNGLPAVWRGSIVDKMLFLALPLALIAWGVIGNTVDVRRRNAPDGQSKFIYTSPVDGWRNIRLFVQWLRKRSGLASKLHALPGTQWFFNRKPWQVFLIAITLSPLTMWANDVLIVWGRVWPLSYQWLSALFDAFLAVGLMLLVAVARAINFGELPGPVRFAIRQWWMHVLVLAAWAYFSISHTLAEVGVDHSGPNAWYHNWFLVPFLGYAYTLLVAVGVAHLFVGSNWVGPGIFINLVTVLALVPVAAWVWAGKYDGTHQFAPNGVSKHRYANPQDKPWCGGIITVHICGPVKR